ncbi:MAG: hypothetical protein DME18_01585 [Verrucomicrobia bacterium]|nr:MAG: hypothetical protein DME18_01585 [Verrucomicrobiota bacterium]
MPLIVTPGQLTQRAELYHQLASLMSAGVGMIPALEMICRRPPSHSFRKPLSQLIAKITQGATVTESMLSLGRWLPSFDLALIQAAEQSGRLPESFRLLANYYNERAQLVRSLMSQVAYPILLLHFALLVFPTPMLTRLVWNGEIMPFLQQKFAVFVPLYAVVFMIALASQGRHGEAWRSKIERITSLIWILGRARRELALARLSAALEALISAGVSILDSWPLAAEASGSPALRRAVQSWKPRLQSGETPGEMLVRGSDFPELFSNLYNTGEISGQLDDSLRRLHHYYQEESSRRLRAFIRWFSLLIYLGIAGTIGYMVISFWTRYYGNLLQGF